MNFGFRARDESRIAILSLRQPKLAKKPNVWYKNAPLGKNSIVKFLSEADQRAALSPQNMKVANH